MDALLLTLALTLNGADWLQTHRIVESDKYSETNIILGKNPSKHSVNYYFAGSTLLILSTTAIKHNKIRRAIQTAIILNQLNYVTRNYSIGLKFTF